jgi:putative Mg2+ transporter-C (MgtC) family protein
MILAAVEIESTGLIFDPGFWLRVGFAVLCGGAIGLERTLRGKPAGLRTNMLICLGAALFVIVQEMISRESGVMDPGRIAAQVVTGIGFLGAGAIIHQGKIVHGLTTAATVWVVAAIGVIIGIGYPWTALAITACTVLILVPLGMVERKFLDPMEQRHEREDST